MADKLIMEVHVTIHGTDVTALNGQAGQVVMIPFGGTVTGSLFEGVVCPGGVDCQRVNLAGVRHMSARYMLKGTDHAGNACSIFVENSGWFSGVSQEPVFHTVPSFLTDSPVLAEYLHQNRFRGEGHPAPTGVTIKFFDVAAE